ncbi:tRNA (N6-threonylcarbamoyladenosine(37)-N6)-methyltransferase TrmO [Methanocorpusculum sp. MG]|uniref:tRNA (N6-threonylcarbamoyladenosine(37)-N6)-methyltransferase TrmO n=1 Tax=Methanocorpusculum petauri TaxID=3002863 RepID=A0ABT4IGV5_9EURY|nr:tRNA (N6-threonylcarbamoyladenosine(37)-N6)-methyltransferase TrmO [Methanocorpusculum petauri]MCZ0860969.1 tRNA (N6-threonylcarbamoyladenosine(37)-N6)-methyltransferase TrmO [Methanocorpusculum petauri]MDE2444047.1 tRNA (N6-threonylcarbamoyladenosine(37)-N6)-methyltransferase TrmO [Methanocorpusculum sp.]
MEDTFTINAIGRLRTPYTDMMQTPVQSLCSTGRGTIEVKPEYACGLDQIETFTHLMLLVRLDRAPAELLAEKPMVDGGASHGIFATRHMSRPNKIGFSVVRLLARKENLLLIEGIDLLDGTPVLDIKPYIPAFDAVPDASSGWLTREHLANIAAKSKNLS